MRHQQGFVAVEAGEVVGFVTCYVAFDIHLSIPLCKEHVSINQLITVAVAEKLSALMTEEYLGERAKRGHRGRFERAMAKVPKVEREQCDRLPDGRQ